MAEKLYVSALSQFSNRNYEQAAKTFAQFVADWYEHKLAGNAQYWIGECYYSQRRFSEAAVAFAKVERLFPTSPKVSAALYKQGLSLWELNRAPEAQETMQRLIDRYGHSEEASKAREKLERWGLPYTVNTSAEASPATPREGAGSAQRQVTEEGTAASEFLFGLKYYNGDGVNQSFVEAAKWFEVSAGKGNLDAQFYLGRMYLNGQGVPQDDGKALKWLEQALLQGSGRARDELEPAVIGTLAARGNAIAQCLFAEMNLKGEGVPRSEAEAVEWYRRAADQGFAEAQYRLGKMYLEGGIVVKNESEAINWLRKAADQGHAPAEFYLTRIIAESGDDRAQLKLGLMYDRGEGVPSDYAEAVKWYRKSAEQGNAAAQFNLGLMFSKGMGVPKNAPEAVKWYRLAAEQGLSSAQVNLGRAYHLGEGVPEDYIEAYKWFILAAAQGGESASMAKEKKELLAQSMTPSMVAAAQQRAGSWQPRTGKVANTPSAQESDTSDRATTRSSGSGFVVNAEGNIITNFHVVNDCNSLRVWVADKPYKARLLKFDEGSDLALLSVPISVGTRKTSLRSGKNPALGEAVLVAGFPLRGLLADSLNISSGNVSALAGPQNDSRLMQISAPVQPGNSGGPVLDQNGLVIGVVVSKLDAVLVAGVTGDIPQNINFGIKGAVLRSFLEVNDVEFSAEVPTKALRPEEIAAKAKMSTVAVECME